MGDTSERPGEGAIPPAPLGLKGTLAWLGPGVTWLAAGAGGAGELLLPPRVGSLYGYTFLWALLLAVLFKWFINREIGRFSVCTGASLLDGFAGLPGPRHWAVWAILAPQLLVSVSSLAGLASAAATALVLVLPGGVLPWMGALLAAVTAFLLLGRYGLLERVAMFLAIGLAVAGLASAVRVFPDLSRLAAGLAPRLPPEVDYGEILPWLSFILAGAAGMLWYSYWVPAKGYGAAALFRREGRIRGRSEYGGQDVSRLRGWVREMTLDSTLGVLGGLLIVTAFLVLGAEVLGPAGVVPAEDQVAGALGRMLGDVWGRFGFWLMVGGAFVGFTNTVLTNQDGWARLLGNGTRILAAARARRDSAWLDDRRLRRVYIVLLGAGAFGLYAWIGEPVTLVQIAGIIEAFQIPLVGALALLMNRTLLPAALRPRAAVTVLTVLAVLFYLGFAAWFVFVRATGG